MDALTAQLEQLRLIPVVAIDAAEKANPLADALTEGGLPCAEITLRTEAGLGAIRELQNRDEFLLGAGTVHSVDQAKASAEAGAKFIVTPGLNPKTVGWCVENGLPIFPGVATPTDLEMAMEFGLSIVKFFPAETLGGVNTLNAFSGPFGQMRFVPTGGIGPCNLREYLHLPSVVACGGSWMVKPDLLQGNHFDEIQYITAEAVKLSQR